MSTHDGYYKQVDGLAMGSPPAPHLANGWMSQFDNTIKGEAVLYARYMDDIIRNIKQIDIEEKLATINNLHPSLKFTIEREENGSIPFLDMKIIHNNGQLSWTWYNKPTDTGLIMNYYALAPKKYKRSVVSGFVYRIYRACSSWQLFHESMEKAKQVLERNQYTLQTSMTPSLKTPWIPYYENANRQNTRMKRTPQQRNSHSWSSTEGNVLRNMHVPSIVAVPLVLS